MAAGQIAFPTALQIPQLAMPRRHSIKQNNFGVGNFAQNAAPPHSPAAQRGDYHVTGSAATSRRATRVLADGSSFAVFDVAGDMLSSPSEAFGFFHQDTRFLSHMEFQIGGESPYLLNSFLSDDNAQLRINLTNPDFAASNGRPSLRRDEIQFERNWVLSDPTITQRVAVRSFAQRPVKLPVEFFFGADFADLFEVRGVPRGARGEVLDTTTTTSSVTFRYRGADDVERSTIISFDPMPDELSAECAGFNLQLEPDSQVELEMRVTCANSREPIPIKRASSDFRKILTLRRKEISDIAAGFARISASNEALDTLLRRSSADLISLVANRSSGAFIMAGIPWFATLFGRDSLITALAILPFSPTLARRTLRMLAALQGRENRPDNDEQPGKIVHEIRSGEMAATGQVPFGRYYGSIDSTPLFVWLYARYVAATGDLSLARELWPNVGAAVRWIEEFGDRDQDGYVEYIRETPRGLSNQGWKDSFDAISHADGSLAEPPIALCEVQGYVYAGFKEAADVAERIGHQDQAANWRERAARLRKAFLRDFWLRREETLALALDKNKRPCRVMASNAAHCIATGILDDVRSATLAKRLFAEDMFSGWGIRTLSAKESRYNPMSYHNGSIWPHDNAIASLGLSRIEGRIGVMKILEAVMHASVSLGTGSLPELFCGFPREPRLGPIPYPSACHPQAWGAASIFLILQAMLGMKVMGAERRLVIDSPVMPPWLDSLKIEELAVGRSTVSLMIRRTPFGAGVEVMEKRGAAIVEVLK
jgi:glycogen debranching enzyme